MPQLLFPNIAGATLQGFQQGQQMRANRLVGAAMQNPDDAQGYLAQAGAIAPRLALGVQGAMQQQQAQQQAAQQSQQTTTLKQIGGAARYYKAALQSGNPASVQAAKAQIAPLIMRLTGKQLPDADTPETQAALDNVIAQTAYLYPGDLKQENPISVGPDTTLIDPRTHQVIYQGQGDAGTMVTGMTYNGMPVFRDKMGNLKDVHGNPIPQGGSNGAGAGQAGAGALAGLPAETQAYVPKVMGALQGQPPFDQFGQPTAALLDAVQQVESGGNPNAVSPAGAQGPYQFMPATAASVGVANPFDPQQARQGAAKYLAQLYRQFGGNAQEAIAAYNAGPGRVAAATGGQQPAAQAAPAGLQYTPSHGSATDVIGQRAQQIAELKSRGVTITPDQEQQYLATGKLADFQGNSQVSALGDVSLQGPDYLQSIPDAERGIVKGLLNGTVQLPTGTALKNGFWQSALASVKHADPSWNQAAYKQYADTRKFFTVGQGGQLINSINTAAQHLDKLREDIDALNNGNVRPLAYLENQASAAVGGQAPTNFVADLTPVASELAAVYKGKGVPSDEEIRHFRDALTPNMSRGQQLNVIRGWIDLLAGKLDATRNQYQQSMTKLSDPLNVINPRAQEALQRITALANAVSTTGTHPMPTMSTTPINAPGAQTGAPAPGTIEQGYRFKGGDPSNQANWEPVQ